MHIYFIILGLIVLSALFTALEISFFSMEELDFLTALYSKHKNAATLIKLRKYKDNLIFGILICNNTTNITASALNVIAAFEATQFFNMEPEVLTSIYTVVLTISIIVFAEAIPKVIGLRAKIKLCLFFTPAFVAIYHLTKPFSAVVILTNSIMEKFKLSKQKTNPDTFRRAFIGLTEKSTAEGLIGQSTSEVIRNVMSFNRNVTNIMCPRKDVFAINGDMTINEAIKLINQNTFSRVPIFSEDLDNINGVVHIREVFNNYLMKMGDKKIYQIAAKPIFVQDNWNIWTVLNTLRNENHHLGIIIDEFGGMRGIVTIEDILEELVGDIFDEKDIKSQPDIVKVAPNKWEASGNSDFAMISQILNIDTEEQNEYETLQGFIMHRLKKIPVVNDYILYDGLWRFTVKEMLKNEIKKVEIIKESTTK